MDSLPVDLLEQDWRRELHRPRLRQQFAEWRDAEPALARFDDLPALLRFLRRAGRGSDKDAVLRALLARARTEPEAGRVVLEAMLPGLKRLAGRLLTDAREREELWSALMVCAWERIREYPVERRPRKVAANLVLDCLRATLTTLSTWRRDPAAKAYPPPPSMEAPTSCEGDVDGLLAEAVAAGAVSGDEAELILATRIDGATLGELAVSEGVKRDTLKHRRHRAERRLFLFLGLPVPRTARNRPFSSARVAGVGPSGLAGGDD